MYRQKLLERFELMLVALLLASLDNTPPITFVTIYYDPTSVQKTTRVSVSESETICHTSVCRYVHVARPSCYTKIPPPSHGLRHTHTYISNISTIIPQSQVDTDVAIVVKLLMWKP
jgi:hypothetical protein